MIFNEYRLPASKSAHLHDILNAIGTYYWLACKKGYRISSNWGLPLIKAYLQLTPMGYKFFYKNWIRPYTIFRLEMVYPQI